jgi:hypothetical protein
VAKDEEADLETGSVAIAPVHLVRVLGNEMVNLGRSGSCDAPGHAEPPGTSSGRAGLSRSGLRPVAPPR